MSEAAKPITVKSVLGDDIRRFVIASDSSFEDFANQIRQAYNLKDKFTVRFLDDEQELITVTTDAGLREALSLAVSGFVKILKFQIQVVTASKSEVKTLQATAPPFTSVATPAPRPSTPAPQSKPLPTSQATPQPLPQPVKPTPQAQPAPQPTPQPPPGLQPPSKMQIVAWLRSLVMDPEISPVLESACQVLQSSLAQSNSTLQHVCDHVLGAFPMIRNHPSMVSLQPWLPYFLGKLEPLRQTLLNPATLSLFGSQLLARLPHLLEMFESDNWGEFFSGGEHNPWAEEQHGEHDAEEDESQCDAASSAFSGCDPRFAFGFPPGNAPPQDVHRGVTCDNCGVGPIRGLRYKCSVCPNFDLCSKCEAAECHPVDHPLIKMRPPPGPPPGLPPVHPQGPAFPGFPGFPWGMHGPPPGFEGPPGGFPFRGRGFFRRGGGRCGMRKWGPPCGNPGLDRSNSGSNRPNWREGPQLQATFVRECNLQDRTEVSPSQTLVKTWELQNSGSVAWPAGTKLIYARGDLPCIENSFDVAGPVEPGKTVQVSAVVRTPATPGRYRAFFKLEDNQQNKFGPRLWCDVTVVASAAPDKAETSEAAVLDAAQYLFRAEAKEAAEVKARAAAAFWEREHAREEKEKEDRLRKEATECVVLHAPKEEEAPKLATPPGEGTPEHRYREQLAALKSMGWANEELNVSLLDQHQGNVQAVCSWLLEQQGQS